MRQLLLIIYFYTFIDNKWLTFLSSNASDLKTRQDSFRHSSEVLCPQGLSLIPVWWRLNLLWRFSNKGVNEWMANVIVIITIIIIIIIITITVIWASPNTSKALVHVSGVWSLLKQNNYYWRYWKLYEY